ncbi:hypothetical protein RP20_CCG002647 [Aedes albopictus]|nr:hypothetical protein RP20_CCG002647 [Aedes albopictus]
MVLNRLPKLQLLKVGKTIKERCSDIGFRISEQLQALGMLNNVLQIERLDAPNLTQLSISFTSSDDGKNIFPILRRLAPQLKNVDLHSTDYFIPLEQLQFPKAEVLKIGGSLCNTDNDCNLRTFFTGFEQLKEVTLESTEIALDVLTEACPEIEMFKFEVSSVDPAPFHLLGRLKSLKTLGLGKFNKIPVISSKCNPLVSVKTLSLELSECGESSIERLRHLLPNVTAMDVTLKDNWNIGRTLGHICRNFRGLHRLEISDRSTRGLTSWSSLLVLQQLDQLEELILRAVRTLMVYMPPNPLLKQFVTNLLSLLVVRQGFVGVGEALCKLTIS